MDRFDEDDGFAGGLERELAEAFPAGSPPSAGPMIRKADPKERRADMHRADIARHDAAIITINGWRDVEVRKREVRRDELRRAYEAEEGRLGREIEQIEEVAGRRIELREQLRAASQASLAVLVGTKPEASFDGIQLGIGDAPA